jgi:hypothetical protein
MNLRVGKAVELNAKLVERRIRKVFQGGMQPPQSELQAWIKGADKPGVDNADLFKAVTSTRLKKMTYFVGVKRTSAEFNVAEIVHFGAVISVTKKMRGMFFLMWLVDQGRMDESELKGRAAELYSRRKGEWKPLKAGTTQIIIPGRPFVTLAMQDARTRKKIEENFRKAAQDSFRSDKGKKK